MTEEQKYEEMTIDEYMTMIHYDDRTKFLEELNRKVATGEITTEGEFEETCMQDMRINKTPPEVGKIFPIIRYSNGNPKDIDHVKMPTIELNIERIMIIE